MLQAITEAGECRGDGVHVEEWTRTWREELMTGDFSMMSSGTLWPALPLPLHLWIRYSSFLFLSLCSSILCCSTWICRRTSNTRSTWKPSWNSFFVCGSLWNVSRKWPRFCLETHKHYYGNGHFSLRNTSIVSVVRVICLGETHIQTPNRQDEHIVYQAQFLGFTWRSEPRLMKNSPCWLWGLLWIHRSLIVYHEMSLLWTKWALSMLIFPVHKS